MRKALQNQMSGERRYRIIGVDDEEGIILNMNFMVHKTQ